MKDFTSKKLRSVTCALGAALFVACLPAGGVLALQPGKPMSQYVHSVWQNDEGLPQNSVVAIAQTTDGYLWLATQEGLARFDGMKFTVFDNQNTQMRENNIQALCRDSHGGLWFGTEGSGLFLFRGGELTRYSTGEGLPNGIVEAIFEDHQGNIWVGTPSGLSVLKDGRLKTFSTKDGLSNNSVLSIVEDRLGTLWIGTEAGGVDSFKEGKFRAYTVKDGLADNLVEAICEDRDGALWLGTHGGLSRLKGGTFTNYSTREGLSNNRVLSLYEDHDWNLWIGTDGGGLNRYKDGAFAIYRKADGLSDDSVASILEDVEGDIWAGTYGGGLNRLKDGRFSSYSTESGLTDDDVRSILQDHEGSVWIATANGLNRLKDGKFTSYSQKDGLASNSVLSLYEDAGGSLWIGTRLGLNCLKNGRLTTYTSAKNGLSEDTVLSITADRDGALWVGTDSGLNRLSNGRFESYSVKDGLTDNSVWVLQQDHGGALWIGTDGGLDCWKDGRFTSFTTADGLASNVIFSLYEDSEGTLWIGTSGGLSRLKDGKISTLTRKDGLFDNTIFRILEDSRANLWMSCNKGVFQVSKKDLNRLANKEITRVSSAAYGTADGMKSHECNGGFQPAGCRTLDGRLWFPTTRGVAVIDPDNLHINGLPPPVAVERVFADGKQIDARVLGRFPPGTEKFEFHFTAMSLLAPEKIRFKYKLEGFDSEWADAGDSREAGYTNLRPGDYTFRVIACNNDGVWNEAGASFGFRLAPHFYQSVWFYGLLVIGAAMIALTAYRVRVGQIRRRFSAVLAERGRLARELHDTLAQGLVAIGLQLSAASEKLKDSPELVEQHLELAQKMIRGSLTEARRSVWDLRPQALQGGDLAAALSDSARQMMAGSLIRLDFRVNGAPRTLPAHVESNLLRISQEALTNSVKHAGASGVTLELTFNNGLVAVRVTDDGCGFDPDTAPSAASGHFGLIGIGERVQQLGGRMRLRTGPGQGTEVEVEVPLD